MDQLCATVFTEPKEKYLYIDEIVDLTQHWYRYPLRYLDAHPSPRHLILNYDDLIQRPERVIRSFYEQFGYPDKPGLDGIVDAAVKETLSFKTDHVYSYEEMGFTRAQIVEMYADIFDRFGFDRREHEAAGVEKQTVIALLNGLRKTPEEILREFFHARQNYDDFFVPAPGVDEFFTTLLSVDFEAGLDVDVFLARGASSSSTTALSSASSASVVVPAT